jgi:hypothetical protein
VTGKTPYRSGLEHRFLPKLARPEQGESVEWLNHGFEVIDVDRARIVTVLIMPMPRKLKRRMLVLNAVCPIFQVWISRQISGPFVTG